MHQYAAGLIDGEGYIGLQRSDESYQVRLKVAMSDKGMLALTEMKRRYGGVLSEFSPRKENYRGGYIWQATGSLAVGIIRQVRPYLMVKCEAADIAINFQLMLEAADLKPNGRRIWTDEMRAKGAYFQEQIHAANRRGPDPEPVKGPNRVPVAKYRAGYWWKPNDSLFGPELLEDKLPVSGMMVDGIVYAQPTWEHRTAGSASSSSPDDVTLLLTPVASEGTKPSNTMGVARRKATGEVFLTNQIVTLCGLDPSEAQVMDLLPTPSANIGTNGGSQHPDKRRAGNHQPSIQDVAEHVLLPTPRATDGPKGGPNQRGSSGGHDAAQRGLSIAPDTHDQLHGQYCRGVPRSAPRWERSRAREDR